MSLNELLWEIFSVVFVVSVVVVVTLIAQKHFMRKN